MRTIPVTFCIAFLLLTASGCDSGSVPAFVYNDDLPEELAVEFTRKADGTPLTQQETDEFTQKIVNFYNSSDYFGWLLRMSHGMDASTGLPEYRLWWTDTTAVREGDRITMVHDWSENHGGHNILKNDSSILASAAAGYLLTGNPEMGNLTRLYCKGISQTMLGAIRDENDTARHIMARNVVTSNHDYTTFDGYEKSVDYSNWFFAYDRWNCSRFEYTDNPYWGSVWVTNTRSKDGVGYLTSAAVNALYASSRAPDPEIREACRQTLELLTGFNRDIAEHDFNIRTKGPDGVPYIIDETTLYDPGRGGDLASYSFWDSLFPDAECNNKLGATLLAYGEPHGVTCDPFGGNLDYEELSIMNNTPNGHIMRAFHIAAIKWALTRGFNDVAEKSLQGLEERFDRDESMDLEKVGTSEGSWHRDLAFSRLLAASAGYPLTAREARLVQQHFECGISQYSEFSNWNLWDESVPQGENEWLPSSTVSIDDETVRYCIRPQAMGLLMEYCWSPFKNPTGVAPVNCEILKQM